MLIPAIYVVVAAAELPLERIVAIATALPLVIPTYVGAFTLVGALAPGGLVERWTGWRPPSPYGFGGPSSP